MTISCQAAVMTATSLPATCIKTGRMGVGSLGENRADRAEHFRKILPSPVLLMTQKVTLSEITQATLI